MTPTSASTTVCTAPVVMGAACADTEACPIDGYCAGTNHVCTKLPTVGQPCDSTMIVYCDPTQAGALCDATTSSCVAITIPDGGACGPTTDAGAATCTASLVNTGSPCTAYDSCFPGAVCAAGVCTSLDCGGTDGAAGAPAGARQRSRGRLRLPPISVMFPAER